MSAVRLCPEPFLIHGGCGEVVNTSDCGSDIRGFDRIILNIRLDTYFLTLQQNLLKDMHTVIIDMVLNVTSNYMNAMTVQ
ncbi:hypothetical protein AAGX24_14535, partial [Staphylococcus aureus]